MNRVDTWIIAFDNGLRTVFGHGTAAARPRPLPADASGQAAQPAPGSDESRQSGALMRVNHVGEVCAQALYQAQALTARSESLRSEMERAAREEADHLAWTRERLTELGDRPSLLNPLWYAGAFGIGLVAGALGDRHSLGFVVETERQVEQHLAGHLDRLPAGDTRSRAIVEQMKLDEARHADSALAAGAADLPAPVRTLMRMAARVMTLTAHRV
ncbi:MAG: 2-polyprenyl-3-methyl-6-methoxy-1,4-benzoquinone monooxygenase [Rubrivivax sp.]|jgi:ubiquinone biosynthesis monooxygenase Coq7